MELTAIREAAASTSATPRSNSSDITAGLRTFIRNFGNENLATEPFIYMPTMVSDGTEVRFMILHLIFFSLYTNNTKFGSSFQTDVSVHEDEAVMFMLPGLEGCAAGMAPLCKRLKIKICALQFGAESGNETLDDLVNSLHQV